jgi:hypothetical protein
VSFGAVEGVLRALLYEGYLLYPYRASSLKNQQRWAFGSLHAPADAARSGERSSARAEVLLVGRAPRVRVAAVFLRWLERTAFAEPTRLEAEERRIELDWLAIESLAAPRVATLSLSRKLRSEGVVHLEGRALEGNLSVGAELLAPDIFKLTLRLTNTSTSVTPGDENAALRTLASPHLVLACEDGRFVSQLDPPPALASFARRCESAGVYPVLAGDPSRQDVMLASPIIVYDYPAIAAASQGDYFDATEIDEILALRVRSLADSEKHEVRASDPRARAVLERSEALGPAELGALHGGERAPLALLPKPGDHVRLRPHPGRDVFDLALAGELATVVSLEEDFDGRRYCTVTIDADPGRDLGLSGQPGHRFFFEPEELERLS